MILLLQLRLFFFFSRLQISLAGASVIGRVSAGGVDWRNSSRCCVRISPVCLADHLLHIQADIIHILHPTLGQ